MSSPVAQENARPGHSGWGLQRPALAREIEGYASAPSVERGGTIALYVSTRAPTFTLEVFRFGWYQGVGARRVFGPVNVRGAVQPAPAMDAATGLVDCAWVDSFVLTTTDARRAWTSGVHLVRLTASDSGAQSWIVFVVRDDTRRADLLVQLPVTTWQAYNAWGGKSLYHWGSSDRQRAACVSFNRPYAANAHNAAAAYGAGAGEFLTNLQPHPSTYGSSNAGWDCNLVRWLEREGYDVAYCTNLDTHVRAPSRVQCKAWLSSGHDEYWSWAMREHVEQARDGGVHLAFFGANAAYWQVRLEASAASGSADRIMVCWKKAAHDPLAAGDASRATDKWRSAAVNRPEEALIGTMYTADPVDGDIVIDAPDHWLFDGTGLQRGSVLRGLLGYEVDGVQGHGPAGVQVLAASPWKTSGATTREGLAHMTLTTAPSGALVFATGSMQWAWGLDDFNAPALRPSRRNPAAAWITRNLLARFVR
jgi:hypothetical protein